MGKAKERRRVSLNPAVGAALIKAIVTKKRADAALEKAKRRLAELSAKHRDKLPDDAFAEVKVNGKTYRLIRWLGGGGEVFALGDYKAAGHTVTPEMRNHISDRAQSDVWRADLIEEPDEAA